MIGLALKMMRDELSHYVVQHKRPSDSITRDDIILHNIALIESDENGELDNKVVLSLVNTGEEHTLKNKPHTLETLNGYRYSEPPVFLNLYLLISATLGRDLQDAYEFALYRLSLVMQFFQAKKHFTVKNSPFSSISDDDNIPQEIKDDIRLYVDLITLSFEQINHLWGSLGGKQVPFVLYKVRLVKIREKTDIDAPLIEEIKTVHVKTGSR